MIGKKTKTDPNVLESSSSSEEEEFDENVNRTKVLNPFPYIHIISMYLHF